MTYRRLLRLHPDLRRLWMGQLVSEIGDWLNNIAVFALVIELAGRGHEGVAVALYGLARHVPLFIFGPLAGVVTDRVDRRRLMIAADLLRAVLTIGFFVADAYSSLPLIYLVGASLFAVSTFFNAAKRAGLPRLAPDADALLAANSLSASTTAATIALGSALGGIIATFAGRGTVFTLNVITFVISGFFINSIRTSLNASDTAAGTTTLRSVLIDEETVIARRINRSRSSVGAFVRGSLNDFREGLRYVRADAVRAAVFAVAAGWGLGNGAARALYTIFGARLGEDEWVARALGVARPEDFGISVLFVAMGLGGVMGAPLARRFNSAGETNLGARMGRALVFDGALLALFSFMPNLWTAALALTLREMCFAVWWTAQQTLIMKRTAGAYAGRVFAAFETLTTLAMVSSMLASGAAADAYGMRPVAFLGGLVVAISGAAWFLLQRRRPESVTLNHEAL